LPRRIRGGGGLTLARTAENGKRAKRGRKGGLLAGEGELEWGAEGGASIRRAKLRGKCRRGSSRGIKRHWFKISGGRRRRHFLGWRRTVSMCSAMEKRTNPNQKNTLRRGGLGMTGKGGSRFGSREGIAFQGERDGTKKKPRSQNKGKE